MGTNGKNGGNDLFDDLEDSFFRQGDAAFADDLWADDEPVVEAKTPPPAPVVPEPPPVVAAPTPVEPPAEVKPPAPPPPPPPAAVEAPPVVAPPVVSPPVVAPPVVAPPVVSPPVVAPPVVSPPVVAPPAVSPPVVPQEPPLAATPPAPATPRSVPFVPGAASRSEPAPRRPVASPYKPADKALFSAPTIIMQAGQAVEDDESDSEDIPPAPQPPPRPSVAQPPVGQTEHLFDTGIESAFFGDFDHSPEETASMFDMPTQEAPRLPEPVAAAAPPAKAEGDDEYDDDWEASAEDFVDMLGPDPSLVLRRDQPLPPEIASVLEEDASSVSSPASAPVEAPPVASASMDLGSGFGDDLERDFFGDAGVAADDNAAFPDDPASIEDDVTTLADPDVVAALMGDRPSEDVTEAYTSVTEERTNEAASGDSALASVDVPAVEAIAAEEQLSAEPSVPPLDEEGLEPVESLVGAGGLIEALPAADAAVASAPSAGLSTETAFSATPASRPQASADPTPDTLEATPSMVGPSIEGGPSVAFTRSPDLGATLPVVRPSPARGGSAGWSEAVAFFQGLASRTEGELSARYVAEAGRIAMGPLGDVARAESLLARAVAEGVNDAATLSAYSDAVGAMGDIERLRDLLVRRASAATGVEAADLYQDAALVERHQLRREQAAVQLLERSLAVLADAENSDASRWFALRLLRELHVEGQRWNRLVDVLRQMAAVTSGIRQAEIYVELAGVLEEHLQDEEGARDAYLASLAAAETTQDVVVGAERCLARLGQPEALAALYQSRAANCTGADAALWHVRAARALADTDDADAAREEWEQAVRLGVPLALRHEYQMMLQRAGRWDDLHAAYLAEAEVTSGEGRAWAYMQAAEVAEERLQQLSLAREDWSLALAASPDCGPAVDAILRLLQQEGRGADALPILEQQAAAAQDPNVRVSILFRMGEVAESLEDSVAVARRAYEQVVEIAPGYVPALDGLERVYTREGAWADLAALFEQKAMLVEDHSVKVLQLSRAGMVCELQAHDPNAAAGFYRRALQLVPDDILALDGWTRVASAAGLWADLAAALESAADVTQDGVREVSWLYQAARIRADRLHDRAGACTNLRRAVDLSPGFRPAAQLLRDFARAEGYWADVHALERAEADAESSGIARQWRLLSMARAAREVDGARESTGIQEVLRENRNNAAGRAAADHLAMATGDLLVRKTLLDDTARSTNDALSFVVLSELSTVVGDREGATDALRHAVSLGGGAVANTALSSIACRLGEWDIAAQLAEQAGRYTEAALLHESRRGDAEAAAAAWSASDSAPAKAEAAVRQSAASGDKLSMAAAHAALARVSESAGVAGVHAVLAGHLYASVGQLADATAAYQLAGAATSRGRAFEGVRRQRIELHDVQGLRELIAGVGEAWSGELADALALTGDHAATAQALRDAIGACSDSVRTLALWARLERVLGEMGDWQGVLDALNAQASLTQDADAIEHLAGRQRWVLAEKLTGSNDAWDQYRRLHEQNPNDAEVLEALARIAGARGETQLALDYIDQLSRLAPDAMTAARYKRRLAEIHSHNGNSVAARAELEAALALNPGDAEALAELRSLAEAASDWNALVGVLSREASVMEGEDRTARLREIARTWEKRLASPAIAIDAWRKVLNAAKGDAEAMERLVGLAREVGDWQTFVEVGAMREPRLEGAARTALQAELGGVYLRKLYSEEQAQRYLESASRGPHASVEAARDLERIYVAAGMWEKAVEAILRQAAATSAESTAGESRASILLRAAQTCLEMRADRDAASNIYRQVLEVEPSNMTALRFQADYLFAAGNMEEAASVFERLEPGIDEIDFDEDDDEGLEFSLSLFRFAQALEKLGRVDDAIKRYERVRTINPSHLPSLEGVGPLYLATGKWDEAGAVYRQILKLTGGQGDPARLARTYTSLGRVELELGNLDKAERRFAKALQVRPNDIAALSGSADVLLRRGDAQSGEAQAETWRRLLTVYNNIIYHAQTPEEVVYAYLTKGFVLDARLNLAEKAVQHYQKSLAFDGEQPGVLLRLAEHSLRRQDWPQAEALASQGLALSSVPAEVAAGLRLVRYVAFSACGDTAAADVEFAAALATGSPLATNLGSAAPGTSEAYKALRARLVARL